MNLHFVLVSVILIDITQGHVVDSNFTKCERFFYKETPPFGFLYSNQTAICQNFQEKYHFATLYNTYFKIPIYSAYRLDTFSCPDTQPSRRSKWFIEPQLSGLAQSEMITESTRANIQNEYKKKQAINMDYPNTNFDRGHLNPNFYQCDTGRTATFTLTNAVPQDPCFNQQTWKDMEERSHTIMAAYCNFDGAKRYFVTGAVPSPNRTIPNAFRDNQSDKHRDYYRVNVPSGMWTAACCDSSGAVNHANRGLGFSFGYYGENKPDTYVISYTSEMLAAKISSKYDMNLTIFVDQCFSDSNKSKNVVEELSIPMQIKMLEQVDNIVLSKQASLLPSKRNAVHDITNTYKKSKNTETTDLQLVRAQLGARDTRNNIQATRQTWAFNDIGFILSKANIKFEERDIGRRFLSDTVESSEISDEYIVVPLNEPTVSSRGSRCRQDHFCDYHGSDYKWCYTDWSDHWDYCCVDKCDFGNGTSYKWCHTNKNEKWDYCSPRISMISVSGKKCRADHECGLHDKSYYWCYTDTNNNWDYCCRPGHECSNHNVSYKWCYIRFQRSIFTWYFITMWDHCSY